MKRGLFLTLVTVAIALLCGNVFAYAPIISPIPEVWIGDREDNTSSPTVDINFFRFTNAFNFDDYVTFDENDPNDVTTDVRWSFMPEASGLVLINGLAGISDPYTEAPEPGAQELTDRANPNRAVAAAADFWDILDSDPGTGPPWSEPIPGNELDTYVDVFASNGSSYSCGSFRVVARLPEGSDVDAPDKLSPVTNVETLIVYDSPATEGWVRASEQGPDDSVIVTGFYVGTHSTIGGTIAAGPGATHPTSPFYVIWDAPATDVAYAPGYVYRVQYTLRSNRADVTTVPKIRLLTQYVGSGILAYSGGILLAGYNAARLFAPLSVAQTYTAYSEPPVNLAAGGVTNLKPRFEVYGLTAQEFGGIVYCDEVVVQRFPTPLKSAAKGTIKTYSPVAGWTGWTIDPASGTPPFATATVGSNSTGLYIETPGPVTGLSYGKWTTPAEGTGVAFTADKLYRCVYTLQSNVSTVGQIRGLNGNRAFDLISKFVIQVDQTQVHTPAPTGTDYSNWFETMPQLHTVDTLNNNMYFEVDVADAQAAQVGRLYITKVELLYYDIP